MVGFYCSRCGTPLEVEEEHAGGKVRCGNCSTAVRSPKATYGIPFAMAVVGDAEPEELAFAPLEVHFDNGRAGEHVYSLEVEKIADRLQHVELSVEASDSSMISCPYCSSTIARFVRKCPYCRHPLRGL